jgi:hypothetical protein
MTLEVRTQILKSLLDASRAIEAERLLLNAKPEGVTAQDRLAHGREAADLDRAWALVAEAFDTIGLG